MRHSSASSPVKCSGSPSRGPSPAPSPTRQSAASLRASLPRAPLSSNEALEQLLQLRESVPLTPEQAKEAFELVKLVDSRHLALAGLGPPARACLPEGVDRLPAKARLQVLQKYISSFQYNHTDRQYFNVAKNRPMARVMDTAKDIIRCALPIKCLEAVFLGLYLTSGMLELDRIPLGFKTCVDGNVYRHIVLVIKHKPTNQYGALGLSRRDELMYKEMGYESLSQLVTDYKESYEGWWHTVLKIRLGLALSHDPFSNAAICWRYFCYKVSKGKWDKVCRDIDAHSEKPNHKLYDKWLMTGQVHKREKKSAPEWKSNQASVSQTKDKKAKDTEKDKDVPQIAHKNPTSRTNLAESPYAKCTTRRALMSTRANLEHHQALGTTPQVQTSASTEVDAKLRSSQTSSGYGGPSCESSRSATDFIMNAVSSAACQPGQIQESPTESPPTANDAHHAVVMDAAHMPLIAAPSLEERTAPILDKVYTLEDSKTPTPHVTVNVPVANTGVKSGYREVEDSDEDPSSGSSSDSSIVSDSEGDHDTD